MGTPYLGEIRIVSFNFAPKGWAQCNGQLLPINQNQALFSILGTTYGGDGRVNFALPDLRGRVPFHFDNGHTQGERAGEETHALNLNESGHSHPAIANATTADQSTPAAHFWGNSGNSNYAGLPDVAMAPGTVVALGGGQGHENRSPFLVLNFVIALAGIFPSRT